MEVRSLAEAVERIRATYEADEDQAAALRLCQEVAPVALALDSEQEAAWELAELLLELGEEQLGLELARRQASLSGTDEGLTRQATLLRAAQHEREAVELLQVAARQRGATPALVGALIELALEGQGWDVLAPLTLTDPAAVRLRDEALRRGGDFKPGTLDSRRQAYVLARLVVLGASEDEGDVVAPYWFLNADEPETAWMLRRFVAWVRQEGVALTSARAAQAEARPIALAVAERLGIPHRTEPSDEPGCLRVIGSLERLDAAGEPHRNDRLTWCLGCGTPPGWKQLLQPAFVDVVGVFAPLELEWSEEQPSAEQVSAAILKEERVLPRDRALSVFLRFYARHRERIRATGSAED